MRWVVVDGPDEVADCVTIASAVLLGALADGWGRDRILSEITALC